MGFAPSRNQNSIRVAESLTYYIPFLRCQFRKGQFLDFALRNFALPLFLRIELVHPKLRLLNFKLFAPVTTHPQGFERQHRSQSFEPLLPILILTLNLMLRDMARSLNVNYMGLARLSIVRDSLAERSCLSPAFIDSFVSNHFIPMVRDYAWIVRQIPTGYARNEPFNEDQPNQNREISLIYVSFLVLISGRTLLHIRLELLRFSY